MSLFLVFMPYFLRSVGVSISSHPPLLSLLESNPVFKQHTYFGRHGFSSSPLQELYPHSTFFFWGGGVAAFVFQTTLGISRQTEGGGRGGWRVTEPFEDTFSLNMHTHKTSD